MNELVTILILVIHRLTIDLQETVELDHLTSGNEIGGLLLVVSRQTDLYCRLLYLGIGHLRGCSTLPDQVVETFLLRCAFY